MKSKTLNIPCICLKANICYTHCMMLSFHVFLLVFMGLTLTISSKNRKRKVNQK